MNRDSTTMPLDEIAVLAGVDKRDVVRALRRGDLPDQTPACVGEWIRARSWRMLERRSPTSKGKATKTERATPRRKWDGS